MIGTKWPSEKHTFLDPVSGQPVTQLTDQYLNFHLYFTDNSFDPSCELQSGIGALSAFSYES